MNMRNTRPVELDVAQQTAVHTTTKAAVVTTSPLPEPVRSVLAWGAQAVAMIHKEAALVMGVLVAMNVTPTPPSSDRWTSAVLIGYAALSKAVEVIKGA